MIEYPDLGDRSSLELPFVAILSAWLIWAFSTGVLVSLDIDLCLEPGSFDTKR